MPQESQNKYDSLTNTTIVEGCVCLLFFFVFFVNATTTKTENDSNYL